MYVCMYAFFPKVALSYVAVLAHAAHAHASSGGVGRSRSEEVDSDFRVVNARLLLLCLLMRAGCHGLLSSLGGVGLCREPELLGSWRRQFSCQGCVGGGVACGGWVSWPVVGAVGWPVVGVP